MFPITFYGENVPLTVEVFFTIGFFMDDFLLSPECTWLRLYVLIVAHVELCGLAFHSDYSILFCASLKVLFAIVIYQKSTISDSCSLLSLEKVIVVRMTRFTLQYTNPRMSRTFLISDLWITSSRATFIILLQYFVKSTIIMITFRDLKSCLLYQ